MGWAGSLTCSRSVSEGFTRRVGDEEVKGQEDKYYYQLPITMPNAQCPMPYCKYPNWRRASNKLTATLTERFKLRTLGCAIGI